MAREARDMRERRDVDRLDSHFVSPVPPVLLSYPAWCFFVASDVRTLEVLAYQNSFPGVGSGSHSDVRWKRMGNETELTWNEERA